MIVAVADTHTVIWYLEADARLSVPARAYLERTVEQGQEIAISAITFVEMVYLIEKGRIAPEQFTELAFALGDTASIFVEIPVDIRVVRALARMDGLQIPDMPDRIIAATAALLNVPIISRDSRIRLSNLQTIW